SVGRHHEQGWHRFSTCATPFKQNSQLAHVYPVRRRQPFAVNRPGTDPRARPFRGARRVSSGSTTMRAAAKPKRSFRPHLELLEVRELLSTFFVATNGSDGGNGSSATPWATLQHAADTVKAGDTVIVRAGNYKGFDMFTSGTATAMIKFLA